MTENTYKKKLIEVALPLDLINEASSKEKSTRHGNISTMHLWWSRKPLAATKAVLFASIVDDPSNYLPEKEAEKERKKLFKLIGELVQWKNPREKEIMKKIREEILKSTNNCPPPILDPFCGGGSIPLAAHSLGLDSYGSDLNPVAVLISKALVEIPIKFVDKPPINPQFKINRTDGSMGGLKGLAEDVEFYGKFVSNLAYKKIGNFYPMGPNGETIIAWLWCRSVICPNPACECNTPITSKYILSKNDETAIWVEPVVDKKRIRFVLRSGPNAKHVPDGTKIGRATFSCVNCKALINGEYIDKIASKKLMGKIGMAIVIEKNNKQKIIEFSDIYLEDSKKIDALLNSNEYVNLMPSEECLGTFASNALGRRYGFYCYSDYFLKRQLVFLLTVVKILNELKETILSDAANNIENAEERAEYSKAILTYLAFALDRCTDYYTSLVTWQGNFVAHTFGTQGIAMSYDFAEINPFSNSTGNWMGAIDWIKRVIESLPKSKAKGRIINLDSTKSLDFDGLTPLISTDPPYYDMISYADVSDFFYVWLRRSIGKEYPDLFATIKTPKKGELVATPHKFGGDKNKATEFFVAGLNSSFSLMKSKSDKQFPMSIFYAFKQAEETNLESTGDTATSSGWDSMLKALLSAGYQIVGTWPMRTERSARPVGIGANALASSIVIVCRPLMENASISTRREFINSLKRELPPAFDRLLSADIAPVDLAQSVIGPGMAVFSRYSKVLEADGSQMTVKTALQLINQELSAFLSEHESDWDRETRFCIAWFEQFGWSEATFGDANTLAQAKGTAVNALDRAGVIVARGGRARLLKRGELSDSWDPLSDKRLTVWECVHHLIRILENGGESEAAKTLNKLGGLKEPVKELAYALYSICEKKGWSEDGLAYNALISSWQSIADKAQFGEKTSAKTKQDLRDKSQKKLFDSG